MTFTPADRIKHIGKSATRRLFDLAPPGSINLGLGEPDFPVPQVVRDEAIRVINEEHIGYTPNSGIPPLKKEIAAYHSLGLATAYSPASVCVMNGAEEAIFNVMMSILGPGDEALLPDPCYLAYQPIAEIAGAFQKYYRLRASRGFEFDRASFEAGLTNKTRLVVINSPSNPTSTSLTRDDLQFIAGRLAGSNVYVLADEIYRDFYFGEQPGSLSGFYDKTIIVSGLSKMMSMTGWRIGWAVGPEEAIKQITVLHQYVSTCASAITQKAAVAAFSDEGRRATVAMREELGRRRDVMTEAIDRELGLPYVAGDGAYYVMLDVSRYGSSEEVSIKLLDAKVISVPGGAFGTEAEGYLRLSYCFDPALIEEGVRRIGKALPSRFNR
ncbi:MAG TPA: aminotransferase class I/II-fold pyridoxal phosphate-dependent enzyme [Blastocatellia bacterium]|nr:aminotransferase class I/II-fold pyridoxal phosphate-dependent enzyme [Blastocatellia bacterium]